MEISEVVPDGYTIIPMTFEQGPLGCTLRRIKSIGKVAVSYVEKTGQARKMHVCLGDQVWAVGRITLGNTPVNEEVMDNIVQLIKVMRPITITFLRKET